jgi:hypothetical protein
MGPSGASRLKEALSALRETPPKEFTQRRTALAADLAEEGLQKEAAAVKAVRKPPPSVWAVAALARAKPDVVRSALEAGAAVRREQRRALSGAGAGTLRETTRRFHDAVSAATRAAETLLRESGERPSPAVLGRIRGTLLASADAPDDVRSALLEGTHTEDLSPGGFGEVGALRVVRTPERAAAPSRGGRQEERLRRAEQERRRSLLRKELERRERAVLAAEAESFRLGHLAEEAERRARSARDRAGEAQARANDARRARDETKRELAAVDAEVAR